MRFDRSMIITVYHDSIVTIHKYLYKLQVLPLLHQLPLILN
jgi:hypothetical protein